MQRNTAHPKPEEAQNARRQTRTRLAAHLPVVGDDPVDDADIANLLQARAAQISQTNRSGVWRPEDEVEADKAGRRWAR